MTSAIRETLLVAWAAWDRRPGYDLAANVMEDACKAYSGATFELRRFLSERRRAGDSYEQILDRWEANW